MSYIFVFACLGASLILIKCLQVFTLAEQIMVEAKKANEIGQNASLDDLTKEKQTQQQALKLLKLFSQVFFGSLIAFFSPVVVIYGLSLMEMVNFSAFISTLVSIPVVLVFTVVMIISWSRMRSG